MHIPDGYLGPVTYGSLWAAMMPIWAYSSRRVKSALSASQAPFLAMASAFSLIVMIFMIPLPGGTTGHLSGSALIAILLGPWPAVLAVSVALAIQALVFGEGGITALGANCFNIAFVGSIVGCSTYRLVIGIGSRFGRGEASPIFRMIGAGAAAYGAVNAGAFFTAVELGIQPLLHAGYFPYSLNIVIPAVMIPHLAVVGVVEAVLTVLVFMAVQRYQLPAPMAGKTVIALLFIILVSSASIASAHEFWIEQSGKGYTVVFGHGSNREDYEPDKIKSVKAFDSHGKAIAVQKEKQEKGIALIPAEAPALMAVEIDNGYWSKTIYGWKNLPKRKASRVVEAVRTFNYSKSLLSWGPAVQKPIDGFVLDIIPLSNPFQMKEGDALPIKAFFNGKPLSGIDVMGNDHQKIATTDKDGTASIPLSKGHHVIIITYKEAAKGDPDADFTSITASLTFEVNPVRKFGRGFKPLPNHNKVSSPPLRTRHLSNGVKR